MNTKTILILSGVGVSASILASCTTLKTLSENAKTVSQNIKDTSENLRESVPEMRKSLMYAVVLSGIALTGITLLFFRKK